METRQSIHPRLRPKFNKEILELFSRLEQTPLKQRRSAQWRAEHKRFMCDPLLLDMSAEFWSMQSPLDRSLKPCHPPWKGAYQSWHVCRNLRIALLAAIGKTSDAVAPSRPH
jgi:hypothetical protein